MEKNLVNNRVIALDYLRILACFLVILYHVPQLIHSSGYVFHDYLSRGINLCCFYSGRLAVPLFFIISGYLLFPSRIELLEFLNKRLNRVLFPTLFWVFFYFLVGEKMDNYPLPYIQNCQHLWFMFALISVYLIIPFVSPWFKEASNKSIVMALVLWLITLLFPILNFFSPICIQYSHQGMLYSTPFHCLVGCSGYFGYVFIGGCIKRFKNVFENNKKKTIFFLTANSIFVFSLSILLGVPYEDAYAYLSLPAAFMSINIFIIFITTIKMGGGRFVASISNLTFGVYFLHAFILEQIYVENLGGYNRIVIAIGVFAASLILIKLLTFLPYSKYIIG